MRRSRFLTKAAKSKGIVGAVSSADRMSSASDMFAATRVALGHVTLRVDPETIADLRVVLKPFFGSPESSVAKPVPPRASPSDDITRGVLATADGESTEGGGSSISAFSVSSAGVDAWMALDAPNGDAADRRGGDALDVDGDGAELRDERPSEGGDVLTEKPSWLLLEVGNGVWQSVADDKDGKQDGALDVTCTALRLCAGSLTASVGETGFQRALEMQLAAQHLESSRRESNLRFWQLSRTGLHRSRGEGSNNGTLPGNGGGGGISGVDRFTLAMTDDGAPVESDLSEIINLRELTMIRDRRGRVSMHPAGACTMKLDAARVPFLSACWQAVFGDPWATGAVPSTPETAGAMQHYWVRLMRGVAGKKRAATTLPTSTAPAVVPATAAEEEEEEGEGNREEIARLRKALAVARAQAEHWKNVAETL